MAAMTRLRRGRVVASIANMNCFDAVLKADEGKGLQSQTQADIEGGQPVDESGWI
jgi:hypothetical protein